ncbi:MAG: hypothetical protein EOO28_06985 [Comamonadaceae bacterium]|nr:MAG: hypothetical protein EOO28_06985 [Comamonadaceae bacterium]
MKHALFAAVATSGLLFATAAPAQNIERVKLTDNDLTCQQAFNEIRQMDGVISRVNMPSAQVAIAPTVDQSANATAVIGAQVAGAVAQQALATSGFGFGNLGHNLGANLGANLGGFGGLISGLAQAATAQQASQQAVAQQQALAAQQNGVLQAQQNAALMQQAQGRKEHLTTLFLSKGCKMGDLAK